MEKHFELANGEFEEQFANCTLDPALFTHEAHLRLAWIHIAQYGPDAAIDNICDQIMAFDNTHGKGDKFNRTVTVAAVMAVYHFMKKSCADSFEIFMAAHPELKTNFKELLSTHYSFDLFNNEKARTEFVEPDLEPFPVY